MVLPTIARVRRGELKLVSHTTGMRTQLKRLLAIEGTVSCRAALRREGFEKHTQLLLRLTLYYYGATVI
jgi:hypothetical protein